MTDAPEGEQLALVALRSRTRKVRSAPGPAEVDPVARVAVDVPLPHLDRVFDYVVPAPMSQAAVPGVRVRVRFSGRLTDGWVLERVAATTHSGRLEPLTKVVSPDPVLSSEVAALARAVADRYAGTLADVLRAAVPPRHAATETALDAEPRATHAVLDPPQDAGEWTPYVGGAALVARLADPRTRYDADRPGPRAVWTAGPGQDPAQAIAHLVRAAASAGRGVLVVAPDARDLVRISGVLRAAGVRDHRVLSADLGPAARYRAFLEVRRGRSTVVVGTRAAVFAPVHELGLVVLWDDGDDSLAEPHAPYWHAREVLVMRSAQTGCALVLGSSARSTEAAALVASGWAREVALPRAEHRRRRPQVVTSGTDADLARDEAARSARLPHVVWSTAREALARGPVLVQVPRRGYVPVLACQSCRTPARCAFCHGPLGVTSGHAIPACQWCGRLAGDWACARCGGRRLRAVSVGERRTAEELGRAFPGYPVRVSGRDPGGEGVLDEVEPVAALVVATPGAEPRVAGGYAAALLLDGRLLLDRADLRAAEEAVRRWLAAVSLVRPAREGGAVVLVADPAFPAVQAVVRGDPAGFAARELTERELAHLPPAWRVAELTGAPGDVADLLSHAHLPEVATVLGPVPAPVMRRAGAEAVERVRALVTVPRSAGLELAAALHAAAAVRSARRDRPPVVVRIDPVVLG